MIEQINYTKNKIQINEVTVNPEIIDKFFPDYAIPKNIQSIVYKCGGKNNYIKYTDGSVENLSDFEQKWQDFILMRYHFELEAKNERARKWTPPAPEHKVYLQDFYNTNSPEERLALKAEYELERGSQPLDYRILTVFIKKYKLNLLKTTDWTQLPDVQATMSDELKQQWVDYRAAVRKFNKDIEDPLLDPILPTQPPSP